MIDLTKKPKYFYRIADDGIVDKYHISKIGTHNQIKANPAHVLPGRSSRWFENGDNVFATDEEARLARDIYRESGK